MARRRWIACATRGLTRSTYTTGAAVGVDSQTVLHFGAGADSESGNDISVEFFPGGLPDRWARLGLSQPPLRAEELESITAALDGGFAALAWVPAASAAVSALVRSIVPLASPSPDHDVHYSDPELPFSIFVGLQGPETPVGRLRLAEAILHESMHLQLTLIEGELPLICGEGQRVLSPWQHIERPARGILHGLYVFRVVEDFMAAALRRAAGQEGGAHCARRIETIRKEVAKLEGFDGNPDLTPDGKRFASSLLRS